MATVPNQNVARINKENCDKSNPYTMNNLSALQLAMNELTGNELKVWLYFAKNQNGFRLEVSPAEAVLWGIPKSSFHKAFTGLKEKGYLVERSNNNYDFYDLPPEEEKFVVNINKAPSEKIFVF